MGEPRFCARALRRQALALELTYQRNFTAEAIAKRSIEEMRRVAPFSAEQAERWQAGAAGRLARCETWRPLTGIYRPGAVRVFDGRASWARWLTLNFAPVLRHLAVAQHSEPALRKNCCWPAAARQDRHDHHLASPALSPPGLAYGLLGLLLAFVALPLYVLLPNHYARAYGVRRWPHWCRAAGGPVVRCRHRPAAGPDGDRLFGRSTRNGAGRGPGRR